jgi:integrase
MPKKRLTDDAVERLKARKGEAQTDYFDLGTSGLALRVSTSGLRSWTCHYYFDGKQRRQTLGQYPKMSLKKAREKANDISDAVKEGRDPRKEKVDREAELARAKGDIYMSAVDDFISKHAIAKKGNRQHKEQRRLLLRANPAWHGRPVSSITVREVHEALDRLMEEGKGYSANRVYEALKTLRKWLYQRDRVPANIMDKVEKPFDGEKPRERVWNEQEIKGIWKAADQLQAVERVYLRLLLLLGQRRNEIAGMTWAELDLEGGRWEELGFKGPVWQLSATRGKSKRTHTFPLPDTAVQLLRSLSRVSGSRHVFPGRGTHAGEPRFLTIGTKLQEKVQQLSGVSDFTFHDARRTFRTGLDRLHIEPHIKDECLNHARRGVGDKHYSQYQYLPEQALAFQAWANFIAELDGAPVSNVRQLRGKRVKSRA